ncbi:MAG: hypothetical protein AAGC92_00465 [Pseudomonadota bacterium]
MLLALTISQLDIGPVPPERAKELGQLGFMQWLGALPATSAYRREAMRAYRMASPFRHASPAVAVFCALLVASMCLSPQPLPLALPHPRRRGGADARRAAL